MSVDLIRRSLVGIGTGSAATLAARITEPAVVSFVAATHTGAARVLGGNPWIAGVMLGAG